MARHIPFLCLISAFLLIVISPLALAVSAAPHTGQTAVLFDPRMNHAEMMQAVVAADATLVRFGALPGSVIVDIAQGGQTKLVEAGAWLLADPIILGGCQTSVSSSIATLGT